MEQAKLVDLETDVVDAIFNFLVDDFSSAAVALHTKAASTKERQVWALGAIRKPVPQPGLSERVWQQVVELAEAYCMSP